MFDKGQKQEAGENTVAIQAGGNIVITAGITASEARSIALDVAKATFYELTGVAKDTASLRIEEITNQVISKIESEYPEGLKKAIDPDFQYALYTVQKQYGRTGDKDLGDLLVDLLVDRSKQESRDILQIVLNESLETAPKLTGGQLSILAITFLLRYTKNNQIINNEALGDYFDKHISPFIGKITKSGASYQHLQFTGCGSTGPTAVTIEHILKLSYPGIFSKGFDPQIIIEREISIGPNLNFFRVCLNDPQKIQVSYLDDESLKTGLEEHRVPDGDKEKIKALFKENLMNDAEIKEKCIKTRPYMEEIFNIWDNSEMNSLTLTSVGMAIGHANIKRFIGEFADLSSWIN